ncbi:CubicO group peptidase (beta-lactamase class C family) [Lewinella aquimaris]|uniref:CubicO group peptidase (Beta-lactamase class C family) n=1 Tax=Neolewinella aquimaris TaxID=1835722 RepID=A0A840DWM7_9BACT|nr:serine hydrolase domain-containing protein [Neolewinella aquimaris]MBB4077411.1 CubicO group peptidase (beta-lactamase class C family) [Neolewinella aquimaris]
MRNYLICLLLLVFLAPASAQNAAKAGLSTVGLERYGDWLEREIAEGRIPMAEALIYRNGEIGYHELLGTENLGTGTALGKDRIFHLMSMTKPIVSVAFMMLYEEGHFQLNDKVSKYLPEFKDLRVARNDSTGIAVASDPVEQEITIAQVMSHTAGFSHGLGGTKLDNEIAGALYFRPQADIAARVNTLAGLPLVAEPGTKWYYSASPDILSRLIEVFSGMTTLEFLQQRLFDPLGMKDTGYNIPAENTARLVTSHEIGNSGLAVAGRQLPSTGNTIYGGTHGLYSTAKDYLQFCRMLLNQGELDGRRYLSRKTVEMMTANHVGDLIGNGWGFGLGFGVVVDVPATGIIGSEGQYYWSGAYSTYFFIDPKENMISILLSQRSPYSGYHSDMMRQMVYQAIGD